VYSRVTQLEIDTVRIPAAEAVELFKREVFPRLREQDGYAGVLVLATPEGKGMLVSFWESAEAADHSRDTGFYPEVLAEYVTLFRSPPGRESYEVAFGDLPVFSNV
jgi:hypothetical protein